LGPVYLRRPKVSRALPTARHGNELPNCALVSWDYGAAANGRSTTLAGYGRARKQASIEDAAVLRRSHADDGSISRQPTKGRQGHASSARSKTRPRLSSPATTRTPVASPDTTRSQPLLPVTASACAVARGRAGAFTALRDYQYKFGVSRTFHAIVSQKAERPLDGARSFQTNLLMGDLHLLHQDTTPRYAPPERLRFLLELRISTAACNPSGSL
jgi:hypothetical protein